MIERVLEYEWCIIEVVSEEFASYKGFVSLMMVASSDCAYLIDAATLHDELYSFQKVLF